MRSEPPEKSRDRLHFSPDAGDGSPEPLRGDVDQPGAEDLLERICEELRPMLIRLAWAVCRDWSLADDAVQEALGLLVERWQQVPPERRRSWLVRSVQLTAMKLRRQKGKHTSSMALETSQWLGGPADPQQSVLRGERIEAVRQAVQNLPPEQRQVVELRIREGKKFAEIAEQLNVPLGTVLSRMRLAMEKLRRELTEPDK